jgi:hypothetical protein
MVWVMVWVVVMVEVDDWALAKEATAKRPAAVNPNFMVMVILRFKYDRCVCTEIKYRVERIYVQRDKRE